MGLIIFGTVAVVAVFVILVVWANADCEWPNFVATALATILGFALVVAFIAGSILFKSWIGSEYKTTVLNREYGTSYTREEIFYASDVIDTIRELDRKRVEVNGNLLKDK